METTETESIALYDGIRVPDEELQPVSLLKASKITGLSRETLRHQMNMWEASGHRAGLKFFVVNNRRLIRRSSLRDWMANLERVSA